VTEQIVWGADCISCIENICFIFSAIGRLCEKCEYLILDKYL